MCWYLHDPKNQFIAGLKKRNTTSEESENYRVRFETHSILRGWETGITRGNLSCRWWWLFPQGKFASANKFIDFEFLLCTSWGFLRANSLTTFRLVSRRFIHPEFGIAKPKNMTRFRGLCASLHQVNFKDFSAEWKRQSKEWRSEIVQGSWRCRDERLRNAIKIAADNTDKAFVPFFQWNSSLTLRHCDQRRKWI